MNAHWQPTATLVTLKERAKIIAKIRSFFAKKKILEVETPLLCHHTVPDIHIASFAVEDRFLQTSPEYGMKRLLASGSGPIYQITKSFRSGDAGRKHNPEFTMLEWYRPGFDHHDLMSEMDAFLQFVLGCGRAKKISYGKLFQKELGFDPHHVSLEDLVNIATSKSLVLHGNTKTYSQTTWLELLFTHFIEPTLGKTAPVFIYDFPIPQAALAKIRRDNPPVAERFEVYFKGMELANGYHELTDPNEQWKRFSRDNALRKELSLPERPIDPYLIAALKHGLPDCAGVALGIDRLVMLATGIANMKEVIAFDWENA